MNSLDYKAEKLSFVSDGIGGTIFRINAVCSTALTTHALHAVIAKSPYFQKSSPRLIPLYEFIILVLPLLFSLTLLASHPLKLNLALSALVLALHLTSTTPQDSHNLSPQLSKKPPLPLPSQERSRGAFGKSWVTVYRAHMMLMTIICILAVDFKIFPREFSKAETWGTSVMDLGVGSFVFSMGIVSALPLLRSKEQPRFVAHVLSSIKRSAGVLALGLVRVLMVKGVDYPEHASEYGVHWNFFFTLGLLPIAGAALEKLSPKFDLTLIALLISFLHQSLLSFTSLQEWALTAERINLISQNKEGIVSLPGYLAIYLIGLDTGLYILPPDPSFYARLHQKSPSSSCFSPPYLSPSSPNANSDPKSNSRTEQEDDGADKRRVASTKAQAAWKEKPGKLASVLGSWAILWCVGYAVLHFFGWEVSRRLANLSYVIWVAAFNTSFLLGYLLIHTWSTSSTSPRASVGSESGKAPLIFSAINKNGLVVFLIANLLTGLTNLSINTIETSDPNAMIILVAYCAVVIGAAWGLRGKRLRM